MGYQYRGRRRIVQVIRLLPAGNSFYCFLASHWTLQHVLTPLNVYHVACVEEVEGKRPTE